MARRRRDKKGLLRQWLSNTWTAVNTYLGTYKALDPRNKLLDHYGNAIWNNKATANEILTSGLPGLRSYGRDLERNNSTARAIIEGLVANVVGSGIGLEPDLEDKEAQKIISDEWRKYVQSCSVDGADLSEMQRRAIRDVVPVGECPWRFVPSDDPSEDIPIKVLGLESEWLADEVPYTDKDGITYASGVKFDKYGRPVAYYIKPPNSEGDYEEVPASDMSLIFERRRSLQARGESWFAPIIEVLMNEKDLVDAELYAAKQTASLAIAVTSEYHDESDLYEEGTSDYPDPVQNLKIGSVARLYPGEDVKALSHTRPSQQIDPFRSMLRGDTAGAMRLSKRFLDRDVSGANYSSMRADMIDEQRLIGPVQDWFGHQTAGALYRKVLPYILMKHGLDPKTPATYRLLPDGQPYVDPQKDIQAAIMAIEGGLSNFEQEMAKRGHDYRKVWKQAKAEQEAQEEEGLDFSTEQKQAPEQPEPEQETEENEEEEQEERFSSIKIIRDESGHVVGVTNEKH